jgi:hypothetical protein
VREALLGPARKRGAKKVGLHPRVVRKSRVHPRQRCVDPEGERDHDPFDHVEDRLLPLKQTVRQPLDPPSKLLLRTPVPAVNLRDGHPTNRSAAYRSAWTP